MRAVPSGITSWQLKCLKQTLVPGGFRGTGDNNYLVSRGAGLSRWRGTSFSSQIVNLAISCLRLTRCCHSRFHSARLGKPRHPLALWQIQLSSRFASSLPFTKSCQKRVLPFTKPADDWWFLNSVGSLHSHSCLNSVLTLTSLTCCKHEFRFRRYPPINRRLTTVSSPK
jgi:hypothetical protein